MSVGLYFLLATSCMILTGYLSFLFIVKPRMRKIYARIDSEEPPETDTEFFSGELYRVEGRQVLIIPEGCELSVSSIKIRRHSGALIIYPREQTWADYPELQAADADFLIERPDVIADRDK